MGRRKKTTTKTKRTAATTTGFTVTPNWGTTVGTNNTTTVNTFINQLIDENTALKKMVANVVTTNV